jgi:hypothetical protein
VQLVERLLNTLNSSSASFSAFDLMNSELERVSGNESGLNLLA